VHRQTNRAFGLTVFAILALIAALTWWLNDRELISVYVAAGFFLAAALLWPEVLLPLNWLWTCISGLIASVSNYAILGLSFYGVIWPAGIVLRFFGKDPLTRCFDAEAKSYFTSVGRQADAETFHDLF